MTDLTPVRRRPLSPADVSLRYEDVLDQTQYPNLMSSTGCKGWRVMITFSLPHTCTHYLISWGEKGGHRVSLAINPPLSAPHLRSVQTAPVGARA